MDQIDIIGFSTCSNEDGQAGKLNFPQLYCGKSPFSRNMVADNRKQR
jgi:hypothetical protein